MKQRHQSAPRFEVALAAHQAGDLEKAQKTYEDLLRAKPRDFDATHMLGVLHAQRSEWSLALPLLKKAVLLDPKSAQALYNQGVAEGKLSNLSREMELYKKTLILDPSHQDARFNLAHLFIDNGDYAEAEEHLNKLIELNPNYEGATRNLGSVLRQRHRAKEALLAYKKALALTPEDPGLFSDISSVLLDLHETKEAEKWARLALKIAPEHPYALNNLGAVLSVQCNYAEAISNFSAALSHDPDNVIALINLADALIRSDRELDLAEALITRVRRLAPENPIGHLLQAELLAAGGDFKHALALYERALPLIVGTHQDEHYITYLFFLTHDAETPPEKAAREHFHRGEIIFRSVADKEIPAKTFANIKDPDRPLRIGFVSGDLHGHALLHFVEPTLQGLDRSRYQPIAYSTNRNVNQVVEWAKTLFAGWRDVYDFSDDELRQQIIADGVDILIDLSGNTALNRLRLFAMRAAPVQASWIGYPGTTGLRNMDYYLSDRFFTPSGSESLFMEKLVRLPVFAGFAPLPDLPGLVEPPCCKQGFVTFGTFNRRLKINAQVICTWARIMHETPDSRMLFCAIDSEKEVLALKNEFEAQGVASNRLEFLRRTGFREYLLRHQRIDLILDAFPYSGGTTTRHALWMGVPTLTCSGLAASYNQGASLLHNVGLSEFVVASPEEMVARAVEIARNPEHLRELRLGIRERLDNSDQRNLPKLGANFGKALRAMWRNWCSGKDPIEIEVSDD